MTTRHNVKEHHSSLVAPSSKKISKEPNSIKEALRLPHWLAITQEEINIFYTNKTWILVPKYQDMNFVGSKLVVKT